MYILYVHVQCYYTRLNLSRLYLYTTGAHEMFVQTLRYKVFGNNQLSYVNVLNIDGQTYNKSPLINMHSTWHLVLYEKLHKLRIDIIVLTNSSTNTALFHQ